MRCLPLALVLGLVACGRTGGPVMSLDIRSPSFADGGAIPAAFTCEGEDTAPALSWSGLPAAAASLVLVVDDPDAPDPAAPTRTWVHWLVYDLPPATAGLPEGGALPAGARTGKNDWGRAAWGGPCPPIGRHRYFFKLYALDRTLGDLAGPDKAALEKAMKGHILAQGQLVGTYQKR